ncbi:MAG: calcium/sodium antiporter [Saprospiraceae bacterium]|nr:calcium/sodium antiporter [bacterium]MDB4443044.1 calcium/sodium antiporter [Saprospiraceae bacterium]MDC3253328.1 calcium/sodium antiporter [bacterium]MDG1435492.1 calcium/sodium antiporter [Saprospiraceae bacterium]MDG2417408.1 calcium/sodium antiporter [Saprospiraceae bacterium]
MNIEILTYAGLFVGSIAVLLKASDWFIDSAEEIGLSLGISPYIIGVTIIAFGTSLPELATSVASVLAGESEIVLGNVVGSNITNIALVIGLVAIYVKEIRLDTDIWKIDMPFLYFTAFFLWFIIRDQDVSYFEGGLLLLALLVFLVFSLKSDDNEEREKHPKASIKSYFLMIVGAGLVWLGASYTVVAIQKLSNIAGIGSGVIALSAVALGTSLPEVIVSLNAAKKGKTGIAIGNVLGSNIFNTLAVIGIPTFVGDLVIKPEILSFSLPLMLAMTILFGVICFSRTISRWEGCILVIFYIYFLVELFTPAHNLMGG